MHGHLLVQDGVYVTVKDIEMKLLFSWEEKSVSGFEIKVKRKRKRSWKLQGDLVVRGGVCEPSPA
jgi:hypothetical protein